MPSSREGIGVDPRMSWAILPLLGVLLIAGCLAGPKSSGDPGGDDVPPIQVPVPQNATYEYEAVDGTASLTVEPRPSTVRLGPGLASHPTWELSIEYRSGRGEDEPFGFQEAVDPATGLLVQQIAWCGAPVGDRGDRSCWDDRTMVLTAAGGLPGGLGAGPFWGETLAGASVDVPLASVLSDTATLTFEMAAVDAHPKGCVEMAPDPQTSRIKALGLTGGLAPFVLCDGLGLPAEFTVLAHEKLEGERFELVERSGAFGGWDASASRSEPLTWGQGVASREASPPLVVATPQRPSNFSVLEADEIARDRSDAYRSMMNRGAWVVGTHLSRPHESGSPTHESATYERTLHAVSTDGKGLVVTVQKTIRETGVRDLGRSEESYEITEETPGRWTTRLPQSSGYPMRQLDVSAGLDAARKLTGQPFDALGHGLWSSLPVNIWHNSSAPRRSEGYTLVSWHQDPNPQNVDGMMISRPYQAVFDGPTGSLLWVTTVQDLPLVDDRPEPRGR